VGRMTTNRRYRVGRDLTLSELTRGGACLQGRQILRPGEVIVLAEVPSPEGRQERRARVEGWAVVELGKEGTVYRGVCRWVESTG
jgi:hypothetical protein